jgi:membrane protein
MAVTSRGVLSPLKTVASHTHPVARKFLSDRGPHLAAMVAYYALLSLVPFLVLTVSLLALQAGSVTANSYVIRELQHILPGQSVRDLEKPVQAIHRNASTLGLIGLIGLFWTSLGFYSSLESALNIVFQVQNRAFFHQKWVTFVLVVTSLSAFFASLLVTTTATGWFDRGGVGHHLVNIPLVGFLASLGGSTIGSFIFLMAVYRYLTNVELRFRDVWIGAVAATVLFQISFLALPLYLRFSNQLIALRAFGGLVILLVWLYLMANIIVLGAEINWWFVVGRNAADPEPDEPVGFA